MAVQSAGIDTWSVGWRYAPGGETDRRLREIATVPAKRSLLVESSVAGHRVGCFPGVNMMFVEGHPCPDGLGPGDSLEIALERVYDGLGGIGLDPRKEVGRDHHSHDYRGEPFMRRMDSTVDMTFEAPAEGLAVLAGVAALPVSRYKTFVAREAGGRRVETVELRGHGGRNLLGRWYDKGVESGRAPRGTMVRPEDQRRFVNGGRPLFEDLVDFGSRFVRDSFVRRFEPLWKASKGVKVGSAFELAIKLGELQDAGKIKEGEALRVAGYLLLETARANRQSRASRYRNRALARDHGLVLADGVLDEVEIDLQDVIEEALEAEAWGYG